MQPDYQAEVHDHGTIRIALATPSGQENQRLNDRVQLKIEKHKELSISGRNLRMRFSWSKGYSGEWLAASAWGDVQLYRRPLGLIFIVEAKRQEDADKGIEEYIVKDLQLFYITEILHIALRKELNASVYDGRCLLVGSKSSQQLKPDILHFPSVDAWKTSWKDIEDLVTSIYYILESKRVERSSMSSSNSDKSYPMLMAPFERREGNIDFDSRSFRKKLQGRLRKHIGDLCLLCGLPQEALIAYHSALDALRLSQDHLWVAASLESLCAVTASYSSVVKSDHCLESPNDIFEKYREAVINYSKFKEAGVLELEACLKATKVLVDMGRNLDASDFLQNTIYIGIKLPSEREIERLSTLADLYGIIGFKRKEAFYKRVAAMYCVADQNNSEARWQQCFSLLRESLPGFSLEHVLSFIKSSEYETDLFLSSGESTGWPAVQARVLHELAFSARKIGDTKLAIKLLSGLLHSSHSFLNKSEQEEMLQALKNYSSACREESEILSEPICLPSFVNVAIPTGNGDPNLEPIETNAQQTNRVFIYSPFEKNLKKIRWVKSEVNTIELVFYNPLAAEIDVSHISLVAKGDASPVNVKPQSLRLAPGAHVSVKIDCICEIVGEFEITGYRVDLYGLIYEVHFDRLLKKRKEINILKSYKIEVIDTIPMLAVDMFLAGFPKAQNIVREVQENQMVKYKSAFYDGEHQKISITIENVSQIPIGEIEVYQEVGVDSKCVVKFSCENPPSSLKPGERVMFEAFFDSELKDSKIETVLHYIKINYKEAYDVGYMRTHTTIFESDIIRPLDVIGLCVKQSESSEYATIVLECHNKAIEEIDIIQT
ncbi:unnamed protein product [Oikopleura dioica]|nr:unnamed protein product [Oikopleura dioica]